MATLAPDGVESSSLFRGRYSVGTFPLKYGMGGLFGVWRSWARTFFPSVREQVADKLRRGVQT